LPQARHGRRVPICASRGPAIFADPVASARYKDLGASLLPGTAAEFTKLVADETEKWGKVVKFAGAKVT